MSFIRRNGLRLLQQPIWRPYLYCTPSYSSGPGAPDPGKGDLLIYPDPPSSQHHDMASFLSYAEKKGLNTKSTVYVGTLYEYSASQALSRYGFYLRRIGGASDSGTDLLGTWTPPSTSVQLRTLIQCKAGGQAIGPQQIRELEGTFVGAPPGWRGAGVMGILVAERVATKGLREALRRSQWPMGFVSCTKDGLVQQFLWNAKATELGLDGLAAVARYRDEVDQELVLTLNGKTLPIRHGGEDVEK